MKWIDPLKKEPPFEKMMVLLHDDGTWESGYLKRIETLAAGKLFIFTDPGYENELTTIKYYLIPEPPK